MPANYTPEEISNFLEQFFNVVGTRQYIGARYVPMFGRQGEESIEWDNSAPYEPLTIVLYQGNSYTSRTYVPTGALLTDTRYWVETGNYSGQIEAYREEVLAFDGRITANANAIVAEQNARILADNALGVRIDNILAKKKMIVIGDSFSSSTQTGGPLWYTYVANKYNLDVYTTASDGQGFVVGQNKFQTQLENAISHVPASQVERVFVLGGLNDTRASSWDVNTFSTAVSNLFVNIRTAYPNALVEIYGPESFPNVLRNNSIASAYMAYFAGDNGFEYHDMSVAFQFSNNFFGGQTGTNEHPSARGSKQIAAFVLSHGAYSTGNFVVNNMFSTGQTPEVLDSNNEVLPNVIARQGAFYSKGVFKYFVDLNLANVPTTVTQIKIRSPYKVSDYFQANVGSGDIGSNDYCDIYLSKIPTNEVVSGWCDLAQHSINFTVNGNYPIKTGSGSGRVVFTGVCR